MRSEIKKLMGEEASLTNGFSSYFILALINS
jgi:hypothetical protein